MNKAGKRSLLFFSLLPLLGSVSSCSSYSLPSFASGETINFTAYAGPTVANWSGVSKNPETITEEHYAKIKEAGFNKIIALYEGATSDGTDLESTLTLKASKANADAKKALAQAEKQGLSYYVRDWSFYGMTQNGSYCLKHGVNDYSSIKSALNYVFTEESEYLSSSSYAGNFCFDEPRYDELSLLGDLVRAYKERMAELKVEQGEPLVNLNPVYVGGEAMGGHSYSEYLDEYIDKIGKQIGYLSYDFYPFLSTDGSYVRSMYLYNLELAAAKCKSNGLELRTFVQSTGDSTGLRDLTSIADYRFQIYTNLAFGSYNQTYYVYAGMSGQSEGYFGLFNLNDGQYNYTYDLAKKVNNEVHAFENVITSFSWDGVMYYNANPLYDNQNFANLSSPLASHDRVSIKTAEQDTLLTTYKGKKDGSDAFMLLNFTDPYQNSDDEVTLHFNDAKALLMYRFGQKMVVELDKNGDYTFLLAPGEGRFIVPLR